MNIIVANSALVC